MKRDYRCIARRRARAGLTLLELLVVLVITTILASAVSYAMMAEVSMQRLTEQRRAAQRQTSDTEREIARLLRGAKFTASTTSTTTTTTTSTSVGTTTYFQGLNDGGQSLTGSDRLTFTTTAPGVPPASLYSTDDFQTQADARGPVGGVSEVSIGLQPVGSPSAGQSGLFERLQRPSDTDPTQGGYEWVLDPTIDQIGFEFWDGQQWQPTWDTTNGETVLPQSVRVTYTIKNEEGSPEHTFIVSIPASTVDAQHPATSTTSVSTTAPASGGAGQ